MLSRSQSKGVFAGLAVFVLLAGFMTFRPHQNEPEYRGRPLSDWVLRLPGSTSSNATFHLGSNAVPYLVEWIGFEGGWFTSLRRRYAKLTHKPALRADFLASQSVDALSCLPISDQISAREGLRPLLNERTPASDRALSALYSLKEVGEPPLLAALTNTTTPPEVRSEIAGIFWASRPKTPGADRVLFAALDDRQPLTSLLLIDVLIGLTADAPTLVPRLTNYLRSPVPFHRIRSCELLERFHIGARSAVPELTLLLTDPDKDVRSAATNALRQIEPGSLPD